VALVLVGLGAIFGLVAAALGLFALPSPDLSLPWPAVGEALVGMDPLSAFFLVPIFLVGGLGSWYSLGYRPAARFPRTNRRALLFWGLLVAGLALLVIARQAFAFLLGWEAMAMSAFFLVTLDDDDREARRAGFVYIMATHVGTLILFALFAYWKQVTGSFAFTPPAAGVLGTAASAVIFLLALLAFGLKAGTMPLHFWLPGAHASSPSHVSARLSGVVLKMGIYGLLRFLMLLPSPPVIWGEALIAVGAASSILGVAFALAQHDLKRLLAYHSVENIGIIVMGVGLALLGCSADRPEWTVLGLGAALLHVWNHSLFKSLLFLAAGSVVERSGTRKIELLGGLSRAMPWTAALFLVGSVAISGLPPLNGFVSEFLLYFGSFGAVLGWSKGSAAAIFVVPALAATGALALACFVKVHGVVFLGSPRAALDRRPRESPTVMIGPMLVLAGSCLVIGLLPGLAARVLDPVIAFWTESLGARSLPLSGIAPLADLGAINLLTLGAIALAGALVVFLTRRRRAIADKPVGTWDCGYAVPTPRMQYGASSFARSLTSFFGWALRPRVESPRIEGAFPAASSMESHVDDATLDRLILPVSRHLVRRFGWFNRFQQGQTQNYLLYILVTVLVLLGTLIPFGDWLSSLLDR
jgi:hydrogenase-4 component B